MTYSEFIESKKHLSQNYGIPLKWVPEGLFDFQKYVCEYGVKKGRSGEFLDTGLGKTIIELTHAQNYIQHTNKPVLIITPLAVAFQFIKEARKFGIDDIEYSKDGHYTKKIVVIDNVLPFRDSKEEDDEKHVHPLQLDVIDRLVTLYSNPGEVVLTPFMGVGSEVYSPVSLNRKAIGIELKESYFKQAKINMEMCKSRFVSTNQLSFM